MIFSILFWLDAATGFTFFQFVYGERVVALLFAVYIYFYTRNWKSKRPRDQCLTILLALVGIFFKDTDFVLFTIPPMFVLLAGWVQRGSREQTKAFKKKLEARIKTFKLKYISSVQSSFWQFRSSF